MQTEKLNTMATGRITKKVLDYIADINKQAKQMSYVKDLKKINRFAQMLRDDRFRQHRLNSKKIYNRKKYNIKKIED